MKSILCLLPVLLLSTTAQAATVMPHRAVYDLSLLRTNGSTSLQSAAGRLAYEVEGSTCDGFTVNFRMATKYRPKDGDATLIDITTTSYEGPGALEFRHQSKEQVDGNVRDDHSIKLTRTGLEAEGKGTISSNKPPVDFTVRAGTLLPMQHQLRLMALGETGGGRDSSVIFDGSDDTKSFQVISFVGKEKPPGTQRDSANPAAAPLKNVGAWPTTISYFPLDGNAEIPEYQVSFDIYKNGVVSGLVLDYGEFALEGKLVDLKMLEPSDCP